MNLYFSNAFISGLLVVGFDFSYYFVNVKGTVMQIEKALIVGVSKVC